MVIEKKHIILIGLAMLIWIVTFLENISTIDAQMIVNRYAYLVLHSDGSAAVRIVDPQNPMQPIELVGLPVNAGEYAGQGFLSPTGDWLLFQVFNEDIIKWRLFNIKSSATFDVFEGISFAEPPMTFDGEYQSFSWSPDGKYFAINYLGTNGLQGIHIYNIVSHSVVDISSVGTNYYEIAWSNDSTKIATFNFTCNQNTCSRVSLDVFTLTGSLLKSVDLSSLTNFPSSQGKGFCQLQWSPNNNFIGFVQQCDITALGKPREVYIADISQGSLIQATFQTPEDMIFETSLFWAAYEITWINTRSLLIGVYKMDGILSTDESGNFIGISPPDVRNTLLFDVQDRTTQQISASRLGLWAYFEPNLLGYLDYIYPEDERLPSDANVEVATYDGTTLSVSASGPSGCHLTWDMSGTILAYFAREATYVHNCDGYVETIVFLDSVDGDISYHNTNEARAIGLGWISLANTPEPTPIPNPCTAYPITTPDLITAITAVMVSS